jgi:hypothetical protein
VDGTLVGRLLAHAEIFAECDAFDVDFGSLDHFPGAGRLVEMLRAEIQMQLWKVTPHRY